jgi:hypothetical protein
MTTLQTVLNGATVITANTAPALGSINSYNASAGALSATLPQLSTLNVGANCVVEKSTLDTTVNTVTLTTFSGDTFDDTTTTLVLATPGEKRVLQVVSIGGTAYWKVIDATYPDSGLVSIGSEFSLTNSATATTIITATPGPANLPVGATYRITLNGTIQTAASSPTLTFTPFIQGTALVQTAVMPSQAVSSAVGFHLETTIAVRATGTSGKAIARNFGIIQFATPVYLFGSTSTTTTTINTTTSTALSMQAQWSLTGVGNSLLIETATIERVV